MAISIFKMFKRLVPNSTVKRFPPDTVTAMARAEKDENHHHNVPPTVLILGWGGAKASSLNKQRDYYASKGFSTVVHVMPLGVLGFIRTFYEQDIMDNIRVLNYNRNEDSDTQVHPVALVHCYSNNGIWTLAGLCRNYGLKPHRIIFDSTPGLYFECQSKQYHMKLCEVFTSSMLATDTYWHPLLSPLILMVLYPLIQFGNIIVFTQKLFGVNLVSDIIDLNIFLRDHPKDIINDDCKSLFIYSRGDKLLPSWLIDEYVQNIKNKGIRNVKIKVFGHDVPHTSSFYKHPEEYKEEIELLLQSSSSFDGGTHEPEQLTSATMTQETSDNRKNK